MKSLLLAVTFAVLTFAARAATVVWDSLDAWNASTCYLESDLGYPRSLSLGLAKNAIGHNTYSYQANKINLMFFGNWIQAYAGDIVSDRSFANDTTDMVYTEGSEGTLIVSFGASAVADVGDHLYLAFKCGYENSEMEVSDPVYGWVSFAVGRDGSLEYSHSAWDLDGGAMIVGSGAIPEPSSGLLLLMGFAVLSLKRKFGGTL